MINTILCRHCGGEIPRDKNLCIHCNRDQRKWSIRANGYRWIIEAVVPLTLIALAAFQLIYANRERVMAKDALDQANEAKIYADSIKHYAVAADLRATRALFLADSINQEAKVIYNYVDQLRLRQDSVYTEFKETILFFTRLFIVHSSTMLQNSKKDWQRQYYARGVQELVIMLIPDKEENYQWWMETFRLMNEK